jgi:hypothetical protein
VIHLICFVKAKQGLSREDFRAHWADVHGPLVADVVARGGHTEFYAQYSRTDADYDRPGAPDFDGVAVQSFQDMDDFHGFLSLPDVAGKLGLDGPEFMDGEKSVFILTDEPRVLIDKTQ